MTVNTFIAKVIIYENNSTYIINTALLFLFFFSITATLFKDYYQM